MSYGKFHKARKEIELALSLGLKGGAKYKLKVSDDMIDIAVLSPAFTGVRIMQRFEMMNDVLERLAPEAFSDYTFVYAPFATEEDYEKHPGIARKFASRKWYDAPKQSHTSGIGHDPADVGDALRYCAAVGPSGPDGISIQDALSRRPKGGGPVTKVVARVFTAEEQERIKQFRTARSLTKYVMRIRDDKKGDGVHFACEANPHGDCFAEFYAYHNPVYTSPSFQKVAISTGLKVHRQMDMEKYQYMDQIHRLPQEEKPTEKFRLDIPDCDKYQLGDVRFDPMRGGWMSLTEAGWVHAEQTWAIRRHFDQQNEAFFQKNPGLRKLRAEAELKQHAAATDKAVGDQLKEKLEEDKE